MKVVFWLSLGTICYVYVGYPLVLTLFARWCARPTIHNDGHLPTVSLVIAAYNEEKVLAEKLRNSVALDYPKALLEIVVASDGSTDGTNAIAKSFEAQGIVLHTVNPRGGKTRALNAVIPKTHGEILVLSDANAMYQPDAIRQLVRHFADPTVGAVSGDVRLMDAADAHADSEGLYYQYERYVQTQESRIGSIIGADGAMYAVARKAFRPPSSGIIVDDFVISMTVARLGFRVLYEPRAVAFEGGTPSGSEEFRRKIRIVSGGIQAFKRGEGLPMLSQPFLWFCYGSHKLLRWLLPLFLLWTLVSSVVLATEPLYLVGLILQVLCYVTALAYAFGIGNLKVLKWSGIPYYFCLVNGAALIGLWKGLVGGQSGTWQRTTR